MIWFLVFLFQRWREATGEPDVASRPEKPGVVSVAPALRVRFMPHG